MNVRTLGSLTLLVALVASVGSTAVAAPWGKTGPFKKIDADPDSMFPLDENRGPWMIMATTFSGPGAQDQARKLVHELRSKYKLPAYSYQKKFELSRGFEGRGVDRYGAPLKMKYKHDKDIHEIAVLVGDYQAVDDPEAQKVLKKLKAVEPETLKSEDGKGTSQSLGNFRTMQKALSPNKGKGSERKQRGPMGHAFVTTNPMLPPEYFVPKGLDKITLDMNKGVKHSLLDCPQKYTVKVATFTGQTVLLKPKVQEHLENGGSLKSRLAEAAEKAHRLTEGLREKGYEAYEFHDRYSSIVTIGSFASVGEPRADGKIEINKTVHKIMENFSAKPDQSGKLGPPKSMLAIPFDAQAVPVEVPTRSISSDYTVTSNR